MREMEKPTIWAVPLVVTHCWIWGLDQEASLKNLKKGVPLAKCFRTQDRKQKEGETRRPGKQHVHSQKVRNGAEPATANKAYPTELPDTCKQVCDSGSDCKARNPVSINLAPSPLTQSMDDEETWGESKSSDCKSMASNSEFGDESSSTSDDELDNLFLTRRNTTPPTLELFQSPMALKASPGHDNVSKRLENLLFSPSTPASAGAFVEDSDEDFILTPVILNKQFESNEENVQFQPLHSTKSEIGSYLKQQMDDPESDIENMIQNDWEETDKPQRRHTVGMMMTVADMITMELCNGQDPNSLSPVTRYRKIRQKLKPVSTRVNGIAVRLPSWYDESM